MPRPSRTIPLCALLPLLLACSTSGGDKSSTTTPTGATTTYTGAFASGASSGTFSATFASGAALASYALPTGIVAQQSAGSATATGTLVFLDGSSTALNGTFTPSSGSLSLAGPNSLSLTGTLVAGKLSGVVTSSAGAGSFVGYPPSATGGVTKVMCGSFTGADFGFWNIVISPVLGSNGASGVSGVVASGRGTSAATLSGTLTGNVLSLTSSSGVSGQGTLSADGASIFGTWTGVGESIGTFQAGAGSCGTTIPGTPPVVPLTNVSGSWVGTGAGGTSAWAVLLQSGSAVGGAGVLTTPPIVPVSGPASPAYTGDGYTITSGSFSNSTVTFVANATLGANPAGNGTFFRGSLSFTGTLTVNNTLVGTLTFTPPATASQRFGLQTVTGFTFTKR